jgi:glyoxylate reductase
VSGHVYVTRLLTDDAMDAVAALGRPVVVGREAPPSRGELLRDAAGAVAVISTLTDRVDAAVLDAAGPDLRVVANVAVGYDNVDVATAHELGIAVCNTPGVLDETTADLAFLLVLAASRLAHEAEADLRAGLWTGWGINQYVGRDVHGAVLGVVGYGRIGQAVARRAAGFGMAVLHHTRNDTGILGWTGDLDLLLRESDVVSLHVPLTDATRHLIGAPELARMRNTAVLVNTARGPVVDEEALAIALEQGTIFAAGLDVFEREPEIHPRLLAAPRTVLLPHIGSASTATRTRMAVVASEGARQVLAGEQPPNLVR